MPNTIIQSASLHFREGSSDKEYHAAIEPQGDGFTVTFAYGRRGSTLNTGAKTAAPVPIEEATRVFDKLVASKVAKGYVRTGERAPGYQHDGDAGTDTGVRCQLLNPVDDGELDGLLDDNRHCLQQKFDGRRLLVLRRGSTVTGINRRGLRVAIPEPVRGAVAAIGRDLLLDGEAVGDTLHVFDLLELGGTDLRPCRYIDRFTRLLNLMVHGSAALRCVETVMSASGKRRAFQEHGNAGAEGVVFKLCDAPYSPGKPASGGSQLKHKFVETASFVVTGRNAKRSVSLSLHDGDRMVAAGNVTIPANRTVPQVGEVVECRYLYAFRESGAVYQPVYLGPRDDIPPSECVVDQLKFRQSPDLPESTRQARH